MAFTVNGELVEDSIVRAEVSALRPRYEEVAQNMDPIEAEMQLRDWSRENVIERVLLRQEAAIVLDPIKLVITNYPEGKEEWLEAENDQEDESAGFRKVPFSKELFIEREDFLEDAPAKFFRLSFRERSTS